MAKILKICSKNEKNILKLRLLCEGERQLTVAISEAVYRRTGCPLVGEEIDEGTLELYSLEDEQRRADARALRLLEFADNNERMLRMKLVKSGFSQRVAEESAKRMVMLGYINEARQLRILVEHEANRTLRGPKRITRKLIAKGYSQSDIRMTISELCEGGEVDFEKNAALLLEKHGVPAGSDEANIILYKNGY